MRRRQSRPPPLRLADCPPGCEVLTPRIESADEGTRHFVTWCRVVQHLRDGRLQIEVPQEGEDEEEPLQTLSLIALQNLRDKQGHAVVVRKAPAPAPAATPVQAPPAVQHMPAPAPQAPAAQHVSAPQAPPAASRQAAPTAAPPAAAQAAAAATISDRARVEIIGLESRSDLNGSFGTVTGPAKEGRWKVKLDNQQGKEKPLAVKLDNIRVIEAVGDDPQPEPAAAPQVAHLSPGPRAPVAPAPEAAQSEPGPAEPVVAVPAAAPEVAATPVLPAPAPSGSSNVGPPATGSVALQSRVVVLAENRRSLQPPRPGVVVERRDMLGPRNAAVVEYRVALDGGGYSWVGAERLRAQAAEDAAEDAEVLCMQGEWQQLRCRCLFTMAPLFDPARGRSCTHLPMCNYDALCRCALPAPPLPPLADRGKNSLALFPRRHARAAGSNRACPVVGCNQDLSSQLRIVREDELRASSVLELEPQKSSRLVCAPHAF